jgi:hypothetical protein
MQDEYRHLGEGHLDAFNSPPTATHVYGCNSQIVVVLGPIAVFVVMTPPSPGEFDNHVTEVNPVIIFDQADGKALCVKAPLSPVHRR